MLHFFFIVFVFHVDGHASRHVHRQCVRIDMSTDMSIDVRVYIPGHIYIHTSAYMFVCMPTHMWKRIEHCSDREVHHDVH